MALVPGLSPNIRLVEPAPAALPPGEDVVVENAPEGADIEHLDDSGNVLKIDHPDGSITISLDGKPVEAAVGEENSGWFANIADKIDPLELSRIAEDLMRGIGDDIDSRKDWIEDRAQGLKLLGLKIEVPGIGGAAEGAPVEGMNRVRHPLLLEAVLRFQANARAELLPTDGPVKIRIDDNNGTFQTDRMAEALEKDLNHYLTAIATEYYPDTDRMLLMLGFGGLSFKKVYFCPLRNRPVSETVDADDLIVNAAALDIRSAKRVTHRSMMRPSTVKRLQILGVYRDLPLSTPVPQDLDSVQREKKAQQGVEPEALNPEDRDREIYECYCELNVKGFEHKWKGKESGLEIPWRVTIDVSTKQILSIVRNYDEDTAELPEARAVFVPYTFVPGFGFYPIGLLHILGNTTNAITAAWRELLDAGMYANFPGFLFSDAGGRQNTNIFRVPPGGGALVKTGGMPLSQAIMPLPYKEPSQALMALVDNMAQMGQRLGGASEQQVGEGRADAPVGTTLALIEQAQKILNSVHKRMHAAQSEEFQLLVKCFKEHPESFWQRNRKPAFAWDEKTFRDALEMYAQSLVPQADPNTASHTQRIIKVMALKQLQGLNQTLYDPIAVDTAALQALGWNNPEQFFVPPAAMNKPPLEVQKGMEELKLKQGDQQLKREALQQKAQADAGKLQLEGQKIQMDGQLGQAKLQVEASKPATGLAPPEDKSQEMALKAADVAAKAKDVQFKQERAVVEDQNRDLERQASLQEANMKLVGDLLKTKATQAHATTEREAQHAHEKEIARMRPKNG
ncbi:MAG: cell envelope integrity protein TolA [Alphaproteobacteria bacterium]|jgi:hypothetical protein